MGEDGEATERAGATSSQLSAADMKSQRGQAEEEATVRAGATSSQMSAADMKVLRGQAEEEEVPACVATAASRETSVAPLPQRYPCIDAGWVFAASVDNMFFTTRPRKRRNNRQRWGPFVGCILPGECWGDVGEHDLTCGGALPCSPAIW